MKYLVRFQNALIERKFYLDRDLKVKKSDNVISVTNTLEEFISEKEFHIGDKVIIQNKEYHIKEISYEKDDYLNSLNLAVAVKVIFLKESTIAYLNHKSDVQSEHFTHEHEKIIFEQFAPKHSSSKSKTVQINLDRSHNNEITVSTSNIEVNVGDKTPILSHEEMADKVGKGIANESIHENKKQGYITGGLVAKEGTAILNKNEKVIPLAQNKVVPEKKDSAMKKLMKWMRGE